MHNWYRLWRYTLKLSTVGEQWQGSGPFAVSMLTQLSVEKIEEQKKTPINDQCQSHSSDRNAQRLRARHCALCSTWQTAGSDHIVTFTLSPNVVSDVGGILNKQHHSNHTVMRQSGTQKPSVSYWGGYNTAERAQHPFCFGLFYLNNTEGKSGLSVMWGKDLWIYNDSIIFPRHCLQPWAEKHRNVNNGKFEL